MADEVEYEPYGRASRRVDLAADFDYPGVVDVADIFAFLSAWFANDPRADADLDGDKDVNDIFAYLSLWFSTANSASLGPADSVSDPSVANPYGYCGYYSDAETYGLLGPHNGALYHVRHRVYDPAAGRWLSRDPAGFVDGMNLYGYVRGWPTKGIDVFGLDAWWLGDLARALGGIELGEYLDNFADGAAESISYWEDVDSVDQILDNASNHEAIVEVHDALQTANDVAKSVKGGELASGAISVVDAVLLLWDEMQNGSGASSPNYGTVPTASNAANNLIDATINAVSDAQPSEQTKGGTYVLRDSETDQVMKTGRSNDLGRRELEHARDERYGDFIFEPVHHTNDYAEQRGLEHLLHEQYDPPLDRINAISPRNPNKDQYIDAAREHLTNQNCAP